VAGIGDAVVGGRPGIGFDGELDVAADAGRDRETVFLEEGIGGEAGDLMSVD